MCSAHVFICIGCRPTIPSYVTALCVFSVLRADSTTTKYKDELVLALPSSRVCAKGEHNNGCPGSPGLTQPLLPTFHLWLSDRRHLPSVRAAGACAPHAAARGGWRRSLPAEIVHTWNLTKIPSVIFKGIYEGQLIYTSVLCLRYANMHPIA